jgi:hypothetical protein
MGGTERVCSPVPRNTASSAGNPPKSRCGATRLGRCVWPRQRGVGGEPFLPKIPLRFISFRLRLGYFTARAHAVDELAVAKGMSAGQVRNYSPTLRILSIRSRISGGTNVLSICGSCARADAQLSSRVAVSASKSMNMIRLPLSAQRLQPSPPRCSLRTSTPSRSNKSRKTPS